MLPTFIGIGAMKSGTTSLHGYLMWHPEIFMPSTKELDFFIDRKNWPRGVEWYERQFAKAAGHLAVGEISPNYTKHPLFSGVPERMRSVVPDARLIYVVRNPVERLASHLVHHQASTGVRLSVPEALAHPDFSAGRYTLQIQQFLEHYPRERMLVILSEDLRWRRRETLATVFSFLGVDPHHEPPLMGSELHRSADKSVPRRLVRRLPILERTVRRTPPGARRRLQACLRRRLTPRELAQTLPPDLDAMVREHLREEVAGLRAYLGDDFDGWGMLSGSGA